jgi:hypothetical protein
MARTPVRHVHRIHVSLERALAFARVEDLRLTFHAIFGRDLTDKRLRKRIAAG